MVEGPGAIKQLQPLWQDQQQWAFALDIAEGQANAHPSLQLPSLPGIDSGKFCSCLAPAALPAAIGLVLDTDALGAITSGTGFVAALLLLPGLQLSGMFWTQMRLVP